MNPQSDHIFSKNLAKMSMLNYRSIDSPTSIGLPIQRGRNEGNLMGGNR